MIRLLEGEIKIVRGKGGGSRLGGRLQIECVFTNTLEVEGIVWSETSEVVSDANVRGDMFYMV